MFSLYISIHELLDGFVLGFFVKLSLQPIRVTSPFRFGKINNELLNSLNFSDSKQK